MSTADSTDGIDAVYSSAGLLDASTMSAKRPNKRGEQTRDRLIAAAVECFTEYGYTKTRVSDITHHANTAQGNFYRHFTSLDDIFLAALRPSLEALAAFGGACRIADAVGPHPRRARHPHRGEHHLPANLCAQPPHAAAAARGLRGQREQGLRHPVAQSACRFRQADPTRADSSSRQICTCSPRLSAAPPNRWPMCMSGWPRAVPGARRSPSWGPRWGNSGFVQPRFATAPR